MQYFGRIELNDRFKLMNPGPEWHKLDGFNVFFKLMPTRGMICYILKSRLEMIKTTSSFVKEYIKESCAKLDDFETSGADHFSCRYGSDDMLRITITIDGSK